MAGVPPRLIVAVYIPSSARHCAGVWTKFTALVLFAIPMSHPRITATASDGAVAASGWCWSIAAATSLAACRAPSPGPRNQRTATTTFEVPPRPHVVMLLISIELAPGMDAMLSMSTGGH